MFRDCCFEYAGVYSGKYNLTMMYIENSYKKFDSGGKYELISDTLPKQSEILLYGINNAEHPLEFSVEIINEDENIPTKKMREIKNWLFGQDGWKTLRLYDDEYNDVYLKCVLIPDEDIADATGYRGLRCTIKANSSFWYGKDEMKTILNSDITSFGNDKSTGVFSLPIVELPTKDKTISPLITILFGDIPEDESCIFSLNVLNVESVDTAFPSSAILSTVSFMIDKNFANEIVTIDLEYGSIYFFRNPSTKIAFKLPLAIRPLFNLQSGTNICSMDYCSYVQSIRFEYTPQVRVGAF